MIIDGIAEVSCMQIQKLYRGGSAKRKEGLAHDQPSNYVIMS